MKEYLSYWPHISAILLIIGIIFDVGYFWGTDINFYTFFSIDEHLLFSIEAVPYTSLIVFLSTLMMLIIRSLQFAAKSAQPIIDRIPIAGLSFNVPRLKFKGVLFYIIVILIPNLILIFQYIYIRRTTFNEFLFVNCLMFSIPFSEIISEFCGSANKSKLFLIFFSGIYSSVIAFGFGFYIGSSYINGTNSLHSIEGICNKCRIVRAGSKGILITEGGGTLYFYGWSNFKSASRIIQ